MSTHRPSLSVCARLALLIPLCGCVSHQIETKPIEIKPIHITMDINLRVQRELDQFFDFEKDAKPESRPSADTGGNR